MDAKTHPLPRVGPNRGNGWAFTAMCVILMAGMLHGCAVEDWSDGLDPSAYSREGQYLEPPTGRGLVASPRRWVPDVALPAGFEPLVSACDSRELPHGGRVVDHRYEGRATLDDTVRFYQQHLPLDGWQARDRHALPRGEAMQWTKGVETLQLTLREWDGRITLGVRISQSSPAVALGGLP